MLKQKVAQVLPNVTQKVASPVWLKKQWFSKLPKKLPNIWITWVIKLVTKEIAKIALFGHTAWHNVKSIESDVEKQRKMDR